MKIKINGEYFDYFNDFSVTTGLDAVASVFQFTMMFDPANAAHRDICHPLTYKHIQFFHDDGKVFSTGTIVSHSFISKATREPVRISGYSMGGVIEDCPVPFELYPLQSDSRTLKEITQRLIKPFGLNLIIYDSAARACDQVIEKSVAQPGETIKDYLSKIACQKNIVLSHDVYGNLIYFKPDVKATSKGFFNKENALDFGADINGQALHSKLTMLRQQSKRGDTEGDDSVSPVGSVTNPLVKAYRPAVYVQSSGKETDTGISVMNALSDELKNIKFGFSLPNAEQDLSIGDIVEVQNEEVYLYNRTRMMVTNTIVSEDSKGSNLSVTLMLPETFGGGIPKDIFS